MGSVWQCLSEDDTARGQAATAHARMSLHFHRLSSRRNNSGSSAAANTAARSQSSSNPGAPGKARDERVSLDASHTSRGRPVLPYSSDFPLCGDPGILHGTEGGMIRGFH